MTVGEVISIALGAIGVIVGVIGCMCLSKANKLSAKEIKDSTVQQAETITTINYGADTYAVIKIAKDVTKEEMEKIVSQVSKTQSDISDIRQKVEEMPKIHVGTGDPPAELKDGDIYFQYK